MSSFPPNTPEEIVHLANRAVEHVFARHGFRPDFTSDTLSAVDFYVETVATEENRGETPPPGHGTRVTLAALLGPALGAYFGVLLSREFPARWRNTDKDPRHWRLEFEDFFLQINPAGVAVNAVMKDFADSWDGSLQTSPSLKGVLAERLDIAPKVDETEFFSFVTSHESIQIAADYLRERAIKDGPTDCSDKGYEQVFGP